MTLMIETIDRLKFPVVKEQVLRPECKESLSLLFLFLVAGIFMFIVYFCCVSCAVMGVCLTYFYQRTV